ncbi:hypothetical protein ABE244_06905 [Bacillus toyonensis]|uniref:hypothetical protein n=1 Tax=Bacillus toyonensis TaxID=155322 RepID=UPI003D254BBF
MRKVVNGLLLLIIFSAFIFMIAYAIADIATMNVLAVSNPKLALELMFGKFKNIIIVALLFGAFWISLNVGRRYLERKIEQEERGNLINKE